MMAPTFGIEGSLLFDMEMAAGPLPPGVHAPNRLDAPVIITCTDEQARAMEAWLQNRAPSTQEPELNRMAAEVIRRALDQPA